MPIQVIIEDKVFEVEDFHKDTIRTDGKNRIKISFQFYVKSEDYHEVTTLLYKNDFRVEVPVEELAFQATIYHYSTSITNLYEANNVGEFKLELIEKD
ncbi:DUF3219 family protein [Oceanobacillus salinisoli]|uniref:DUF3219 family protein n=1 Tax=Oceanobacillus salinisoli TaxID=2678611 RepID=UPI0012E31590|nr:DUF3219 family protein [Oceanobacillus salinisoli]